MGNSHKLNPEFNITTATDTFCHYFQHLLLLTEKNKTRKWTDNQLQVIDLPKYISNIHKYETSWTGIQMKTTAIYERADGFTGRIT